MVTVGEEEWIHHHLEELELQLPFWRYFEIYRDEPYAFLLDSAKDPEKLGQFSFIGGDPFLVYSAKRRAGAGPKDVADIEVLRRKRDDGRALEIPTTERRQAVLWDDLRDVLDTYNVPRFEYAAAPVPLLSGAVGYFGYEVGYFIEKLPDRGDDDLALPDVCLMFCDVILACDHRNGGTWLSIVGRGGTNDAARRHAADLREQVMISISDFERRPSPEWTGPRRGAPEAEVEINAHFDKAGYCEMVQTAKDHIFAGDVFEICTTHRLDAPYTGDPWTLYQELRRINPAPFAGYLQFPFANVVSSSPERFIRLKPDRVAESRPIKGTRPRGATPEEDQALYSELFSSVKDRAENVMIVDLVRNDLGRVCKPRTVKVPELMIVEKYATVFQMVSTICGELLDDVDELDLIAAVAPGGSMTGAPKIEAMKIIDRLEPVKRGIYSGGIGYIDFSGAIDLNIVIRTFVVKDGRAYFNVGGAIVADSDPAAEYQETLDKARALVTALENIEACRRS